MESPSPHDFLKKMHQDETSWVACLCDVEKAEQVIHSLTSEVTDGHHVLPDVTL